MALLKPRQSTFLFGWLSPRPVLTWGDVTRLKLTVDRLLQSGLTGSDLVAVQPDPAEWVRHADAGLRHARCLRANPITYFGADLADVLSLQLSLEEMVRMELTHAQLVAVGMSAETERLFKLDEDEWHMLGRRRAAAG
jgi:hypothetical protein